MAADDREIRGELENKLLDSITKFQMTARFTGLQHAQMRAYLAEHLLNDLAPEIVQLHEQLAKVAEFAAQRAEYVTNLRHCGPNNDHDYYRWTGHAEARRQLSRLLGLPVGWPAEDQLEAGASDGR